MIKLKDYMDGTELTLLDKHAKPTKTAIYLNKNIRNQLLAKNAARWRDILITTERLDYYGIPSLVLRVTTSDVATTLLLKISDSDLIDTYLQGEEHDIS